MQAEQLQNLFRVRHHLLQFIVAVFRLHDFDQLHLVELMHANHAARADARRARLAAKTRRVGAVLDRQLFLRQNFLAMNVRHRRFGGWNQIKFAQLFPVIALRHAVILVLEFRKLPHANQTMLRRP